MRLPIRGQARIRDGRKLVDLVRTISRSGNPDDPFYYLGGPMSNIPQFNFPRFHEVADTLRASGYNIVSPAELRRPGGRRAGDGEARRATTARPRTRGRTSSAAT